MLYAVKILLLLLALLCFLVDTVRVIINHRRADDSMLYVSPFGFAFWAMYKILEVLSGG